MPESATAHDHVARGRAHAPNPRAHVVRSVDHHALGRKTVDVRRLERRPWVVNLQVKRRLVIGNDKQNIRSIPS